MLFRSELPVWEDLQDAGRGAEDDGAAGGSGRRGGKGEKAKVKHGGGTAGEGSAAAAGWGEGAAGGHELVREVLKAADMLQAEGLLKHCLEAFREGMTVHSAIEHLVWAHTKGPEEARGVAMAYVVRHYKAIQVTRTWRVPDRQPLRAFHVFPASSAARCRDAYKCHV